MKELSPSKMQQNRFPLILNLLKDGPANSKGSRRE